MTTLLELPDGEADLAKVERLTRTAERVTGLERMKSQLNFLREQQIEDTKAHIKLLYLEPLDTPGTQSPGSGTATRSSRRNVTRDFLIVGVAAGEISAGSVTYVDLTKIFDSDEDVPSFEMN